MRVYIAGPMRGHYLYNFPAFDRVESQLICDGHDPVNPANLDREDGFDPMDLALDHPDWDWSQLPPGTESADYATRDLELLATCDAIYMLKGWGASTGARAEYAVAKWRGLEVMRDEGGKDDRKPDKGPPIDPKCDAGDKKTPLHLLSPHACAEASKVLKIGADKYGAWNWRGHSIKVSTYVGAIRRHLDAWWDGVEDDSESGVSHIAHVMASAMIVLDAENSGTLMNDRPASPYKKKGSTQ